MLTAFPARLLGYLLLLAPHKLREEGMCEEDIRDLVDWLSKARAGRRLIPQRSYREFRFGYPSDN